MDECSDNLPQFSQFPTEVLIIIFQYVSAKNLIISRQVCRRWRQVIDHILRDDKIWETFCERDYKTLYKDAMEKSITCKLWYDVYRSLTLWGRLAEAKETREEFSDAGVFGDDIMDLAVLKNGVISINKRGGVECYDIATLQTIEGNPDYDDFRNYIEYDEAIVILHNYSHFHIRWKLNKDGELLTNGWNRFDAIEDYYYYNIKLSLKSGKSFYLVSNDNNMRHIDIANKCAVRKIQQDHGDDVLTLSYCYDRLHILSLERNVFVYENETFRKLFNLESKKDNIWDCLWRYEFIETIHWRIFYSWMADMRIPIPDGPLRYISMVKVYGDVFFISCVNGILLIYYKPYVNGQLDFFTIKPVKEYKFAEIKVPPNRRTLDDVQPPIINVDVVEIKGGHTIYVATPAKAFAITYLNDEEEETSTALVPYVPRISLVS